ncbi:MAG TPA: site-specific DNA-methyltransferase [Smithellaceae bacterium]|jgi:DNA modification methylase|nr:site-specific DNA-methyltransferase [Smithellaceae bacterium]
MTELVWEGKYKDGKKVTPVRIALPFQTIETINESAQQRQKTLDFLIAEPDAKYGNEWRNRLIWGDKKYVLPSLLPEFAGKVNLIYIDPPFNVGSDFSFKATISDNPETEEDETTQFVKQPSIIEQKAYRDTWGKGLDSYLQWFYETVLLLKELLADDGSIYVHLDWHAGHYAKAVMDEIFGYENFRNEIVWHYRTGNLAKNQFQRKHDTIFFYSKSDKINFTPIEQKEYYADVYGPNFKPSFEGRKQGKDEKGTFRMSMVDDVWDISAVFTLSNEHLPYDTQKPEALLARIIKASSSEGDLILDCFSGSGTTAIVAEKNNRRWITCDLGRFAIHTTRKRLLGIDNLKPFIVQNLGKYERQQWMIAEFDKPETRLQQERSYKHFIIELYHAKPLDGYIWLHGAKAGRMVHVGNVEAPITVDDIKATILEFWKLTGKEKAAQVNGIDFLGWDFAFDVNETAKQFAAENKVNVSFKKIPREVLEKKAVEQGDIKFYELASLSVKTKNEKNKLTITLANFIIPPDDVPNEVQGKISHWSQWIDYWAIDWNYRDDTFHNEWQSYRTKQNPKIELTATNKYEQSGKYTVLVKVIDILGNDTTKAIQVTV